MELLLENNLSRNSLGICLRGKTEKNNMWFNITELLLLFNNNYMKSESNLSSCISSKLHIFFSTLVDVHLQN